MNIWGKFAELIRGPVSYIGKVTVVIGDGRYVVSGADGGTNVVISTATYAVDASVMVRGGIIEGPASGLTELGAVDI